jgi:hypothetical protein
MQQLTDKQALEIIKSTLDKATKEGIFSTLNDVYTVVAAFDVIAKKVLNESSTNELGQ